MAPVNKISVWTERLSEEWSQNSGNRERFHRGLIDFREISTLIERARNLNSGDLDALLIIQANRRNLEITILSKTLSVSDPQNPNYQNIRIEEAQLTGFLEQYFSLSSGEVSFSLIPAWILRVTLLLVSIAFVSFGLLLLYRHLIQGSGFFPKVKVIEIDNPNERERLSNEFSGIYATKIGDGAMVIELRQDGNFRYYDMRKYSPGRYRLDLVTGGSWRPAYEGGQVALVTGVRYVFYAQGKERIIFLQRPFDLIGRLSEDVPYLNFPEDELTLNSEY